MPDHKAPPSKAGKSRRITLCEVTKMREAYVVDPDEKGRPAVKGPHQLDFMMLVYDPDDPSVPLDTYYKLNASLAKTWWRDDEVHLDKREAQFEVTRRRQKK